MSSCIGSLRARSLAGAIALLAALAPAFGARPATAAELSCESGFRLLHDDRVGKLKLRAGQYRVEIRDREALGCAEVMGELLPRFLTDFDGRLPGDWTVNSRKATFRRPGSGAAFRLVAGRPSDGGGGRHPASGSTACPSFFDVADDDRIGALAVPAGKYRLSVTQRPACERAAGLLARFLADYDGTLPRDWELSKRTATFAKPSGPAFRIKRKLGEDVRPELGGRTLGVSCPATFRVRRAGRIGRLRLTAGAHDVWRLGLRGPSCRQTTRLFARFLEHPGGDLPGRWRLDPEAASFTRGGGGSGFRVKPAR